MLAYEFLFDIIKKPKVLWPWRAIIFFVLETLIVKEKRKCQK